MIKVNVTIRAMGVGRVHLLEVHLLEMMVPEIIQGDRLKVTWPGMRFDETMSLEDNAGRQTKAHYRIGKRERTV